MLSLQEMSFFNKDMLIANELYVKFSGTGFIDYENCRLTLTKGSSVDFATYYNSFSVEKWQKYTIISDIILQIKIRGDANIYLYNNYLKNDEVIRKILNVKSVREINDENYAIIKIPCNNVLYKGNISFEIEAMDDNVIVYEAKYMTNIEKNLNNINIALNICTYNRNEYIYRNIEILKYRLLDNEFSPLYGHLDIYISDNAENLDANYFDHKKIHYVKNRNLGGVGGFSRNLIHILEDREVYKLSHVLMMDDDVIVEPGALERTYVFLLLLKDIYKEITLGGAMFNLDKPTIQHRSVSVWNNGAGSQKILRKDKDMLKLVEILKNEIDMKCDYVGWWYCCMPLAVVSEHNLPLPVFLHGDDVEYCIRNCKNIITLNGVFLWHEPFINKYSSRDEYYDLRNLLITNAIHNKNFSVGDVRKYLWKKVFRNILIFRYNDALLNLKAVTDFCRGIDWLIRQDGVELNEEIMKLGYVAKPLEEIGWSFDNSCFVKNMKYKEGKKSRIVRRLKLNGYLCRSKGTTIVPIGNPLKYSFYKKSKVLHYNELNNTGFVTEKSYKKTVEILFEYFRVCKLLKQQYVYRKQEFRIRRNELMTKELWIKLLKMV